MKYLSIHRPTAELLIEEFIISKDRLEIILHVSNELKDKLDQKNFVKFQEELEIIEYWVE